MLLSQAVQAQGDWRYPVSIKDFYLMINAIRTNPKKFIPRVKALFEDQRNASGVHNLFGTTYSDTDVANFKSYLDSTAAVPAVELDRGLTILAWKQAKNMAALNNLGTGLDANGLDLPGRVNSMGVYSGALEEVRAMTLPQGHTAEIVILSYMISSQTNRDIIRNPLHK